MQSLSKLHFSKYFSVCTSRGKWQKRSKFSSACTSNDNFLTLNEWNVISDSLEKATFSHLNSWTLDISTWSLLLDKIRFGTDHYIQTSSREGCSSQINTLRDLPRPKLIWLLKKKEFMTWLGGTHIFLSKPALLEDVSRCCVKLCPLKQFAVTYSSHVFVSLSWGSLSQGKNLVHRSVREDYSKSTHSLSNYTSAPLFGPYYTLTSVA